jgi:nocardicin N-oxygenase
MRKVHRYGFDPPHRLEPTPLYAQLRSEEPVARIKLPYGEESWLVTRQESIKAVMTDPRISRAAVMASGDRIPRVTPAPYHSNPLSAVDPPEHTRLRKLVAGAFTRQRAEERRPRAQEIADELINDMIAAGPPVDFNMAFAIPFPLTLIGEIFGIPESDRHQFRNWAVPVLNQRYARQEVDAALRQMRGYVTELIARKREQPTADLLSTLVQTDVDTGRVTEAELANLIVSLVLNDSVANQLNSFFFLLLTRPDQLAWLRANMSHVRQAVEELLRFAPLSPDNPSGGQGHIRMATADMEIDGVRISAGDYVQISITSANRDERVFTDPEKLDFTRTPNRHIAFGHGTHRCPGEKLGRMEMQVAVASMLTRFPNLRLAVPEDEVPWKLRMVSRGPEELMVEW